MWVVMVSAVIAAVVSKQSSSAVDACEVAFAVATEPDTDRNNLEMKMATKAALSDQSNPFAKKAGKDPFKKRAQAALDALKKGKVHTYGKSIRCCTDALGKKSPLGRSPAEIVLDASDGFVPLWAKAQTLRWRFQEMSMTQFENVEAAKEGIRALMSDALLQWGHAAPIRFHESSAGQRWDFEVVVREQADCDVNGCVLASAFFPGGGQDELVIYPTMFAQPRAEQIETLIHEFGHVFGMRHFFANVSETAWAVELFGKQSKFTIMNYGPNSKLTRSDKADLRKLYRMVWSGELDEINGTPIKLFRPYGST